MTSRDDAVFGLLFLGFFLLSALTLSGAWQPPRLPEPLPPQNVAVRFSVHSAPSAAGTTARQAVTVSKAPVKPAKKPLPRLQKAPPRPAPAAEDDSDSTVPAPQVIASTATLDVPSMLTTPASAGEPASSPMPPLPTLQQSGPPDTPPPPPDTDEPTNPFPVKPYGDTVVVAFLIDSDGHIQDSRILVPSWNALGDMSIRLAAQSNEAKNIRYTNLNPPLQPGQTRWIVLPHSWETSAHGNPLP